MSLGLRSAAAMVVADVYVPVEPRTAAVVVAR